MRSYTVKENHIGSARCLVRYFGADKKTDRDPVTYIFSYTGCLEQQMYQQKYLHQHAAQHGQANAPLPPPGVVVHAEFDKYARLYLYVW